MKIIRTANYEKLSGFGGGLLNKMNPFSNNKNKIIEDISNQAAQLANELMNYDEMLPSSLMPVSGEDTAIKEAQGMSPRLIALMDKMKSFRDSLTQAKYKLQGSPQMSVIDEFLSRTMGFSQIMSDPSNNQGYMSLANTMDEFSFSIKEQF